MPRDSTRRLGVVDAHAYVGPWAFRHIPDAEPDAFLARLDRAGIDRALVSATEGILYKDPQAANRLLAERIRGREDRLLPVAIVNPALPGWQADWDACLAELRPVALRLIPSYHGYSSAGDEAAEAIAAATSAGLPVFAVIRLEDERVQHPLARVSPVPIGDLAAMLDRSPDARLVLSGIRLAEVRSLLAATGREFSVDISHLQHPTDALDELRARLPAERIWLGSGAPHLMPEAAVYKVAMARLSDAERDAILGGNAERALGSSDGR